MYKRKLSIQLLNLYIVSMSCGGLSSTNHLKRFSEVKKVIIIYLEDYSFFPLLQDIFKNFKLL